MVGDVYKRQHLVGVVGLGDGDLRLADAEALPLAHLREGERRGHCLLYTSDAADERSSVDLGGRRIIKKTKRA